MAQQVTTNNNSLLDAMLQKSSNYADADVANKFDAIFNKSLETAQTITSNQFSTKKAVSTTVPQSKSADNSIMNNKTVDLNDSLNKTVDTNTSLNTNTDMNKESISMQSSSTSSEKNTTKVDYSDSNNTNSTQNSTDTQNSITQVNSGNKLSTDEMSMDTENISDDLQVVDSEIVSTSDIVSQYAYVEDAVNIETTEIDGVVLEESLSQDEEMTTLDSLTVDMSEELILDTDTDLNVEDADIDSIMTNIKESAPAVDMNLENNINIIVQQVAPTTDIQSATVKEIVVNDEDVQVPVNSNLLEDVDLDIQSNGNNKELISQKMVDELNITIEESTQSVTGTESSDSMLMDSTEQAVKYNIENNSQENELVALDETLLMEESVGEDVVKTTVETAVETDVEVEKEIDNDNVSLKLDKGVNAESVEEPATEDLVKETEEVIANSDEIESKETNESSDSKSLDASADSSIEVEESSESSLSHNNQDSEGEGNLTEKKSEMKKTAMTSDDTNDVFDIDVDVEGMTNEPQISNIISDATSAAKTRVAGVGQTVGTNATASQPQTSQSVNITKEDVIAQIHTKLQALNSTTNTKLTMVLNPESLGKVSIQLMNTKDGMTAEMVVASQNVKDILDSNISNLKETLSAQGIQVNDVSVKVSSSENNAEMDYTEQENSESNKQNQDRQQDKEKNKNEFEKLFSITQDEEQENDIN